MDKLKKLHAFKASVRDKIFLSSSYSPFHVSNKHVADQYFAILIFFYQY